MRQVHFFSYIGVDYGNDMLNHFINHYKGLGIENFNLILNTNSDSKANLFEAIDILRLHDLAPVHIDIGKSFIDAKLKAIEFFTDDLPENSWIMYADSDELHAFQDNLPTMLDFCSQNALNVIKGRFVDRVHQTRTFAAISRTKNIWEQFPLTADISKLSGCCNKKVMLYKNNLKIKGEGFHGIANSTRDLVNFFPYFQEVHHFKWTQEVLKKLQHRITLQKDRGLKWWPESDAVLSHYRRHGKLNLEEINSL